MRRAAVILALLLSGCAPRICNCGAVTEPRIIYDHPIMRQDQATEADCIIPVTLSNGYVLQWDACITVTSP